MKWIKTNEALKRTRRIVPPDTSQVAQQYKQYCDDVDEFSVITFDNFINKLDLNIFLNYKSEDFYNTGYNIPKVTDGISVHKIGNFNIFSSDYGPKCPPGLEKNLDWFRRNTYIFAEVNTGGASGGSCYDGPEDPGAQDYYGGSLDLNKFVYSYLEPKLNIILNSHANMKSARELCDILYKNPEIISESDRTRYEYYGNYDNFSCYFITLENLFKFLNDNETF